MTWSAERGGYEADLQKSAMLLRAASFSAEIVGEHAAVDCLQDLAYQVDDLLWASAQRTGRKLRSRPSREARLRASQSPERPSPA